MAVFFFFFPTPRLGCRRDLLPETVRRQTNILLFFFARFLVCPPPPPKPKLPSQPFPLLLFLSLFFLLPPMPQEGQTGKDE